MKQFCSGCKQSRYGTRLYIILTTRQKLRFCHGCAAGMNNIEPAIKQKIPARWAK